MDRAGRRGHHGRAVQVDSMKAALKATGSERLKLKFGDLLSNFAFNFNLRRYIMVDDTSVLLVTIPQLT